MTFEGLNGKAGLLSPDIIKKWRKLQTSKRHISTDVSLH